MDFFAFVPQLAHFAIQRTNQPQRCDNRGVYYLGMRWKAFAAARLGEKMARLVSSVKIDAQ